MYNDNSNTMKKILMTAVVSLMFVTGASAQFSRSVFNHLGLNVGVGTEGVSVGLATPLTNFLEFEAGLNVMPGFNLSADVDVDAEGTVNVDGTEVTIPVGKINAKADFSRTTFNVKASVYPFGGNSSWFVAAGFSFGGATMAKFSGHSEQLQNFINQYPDYKEQILDQVSVALANYKVRFDDKADVAADIRCKSFRPYLGIGFGRLVPKNRIGFRVEMGCQFMGTMKIYQNGEMVDLSKLVSDAIGDDNGDADKISKFVENWKFYPVLKVQLVGRIL